MQLQVLKIRQKNINFFVTAIKASELLHFISVDYWREDNPGGYQRPITQRRLMKAVKYLLYEDGIFPTSILVNVRGKVDFRPACSLDGFGELGVLTIPEESLPLWIIDGQHRVYAIFLAMKEDPQFEDFAIPVSILTFDNRYQEMKQFYIVNNRQKAVSTGLAQQHLRQMISKEGIDEVLSHEIRKKVIAAEVLPIVDILRTEESSPWYGKVWMPSSATKSKNWIISQTSLADSLGMMMRKFTEKECNEIKKDIKTYALHLINYWNALKEIFPEAFESPQDYTIQKTIGCYAFHLIFPEIYRLCKKRNDLSKEEMKSILNEMFEAFKNSIGLEKMDSKFWNKWVGNNMATGGGMKMIKKLADLFLEAMPDI